MKDHRASIEKLRKDAAAAALIRDLATDPGKPNYSIVCTTIFAALPTKSSER